MMPLLLRFSLVSSPFSDIDDAYEADELQAIHTKTSLRLLTVTTLLNHIPTLSSSPILPQP